MKTQGFSGWKSVALVVAALFIAAHPGASAQDRSNSADEDEFVFGAPLRNDILFTYKYTERVRVWILDTAGVVTDSSDRLLTYYLDERQSDAEVGGGAKEIEANIDSMKLEYRSSQGDVDFNTQILEHANDLNRIRHPAVLVPSALVNAVGHYTISPYGSLGEVTGKSIESVRKQGEDPMLDDFTQMRIEHMLSDEYLSTVIFPWRNLVPLGRIVHYDSTVEVPTVAALDRVVFKDDARVTLTRPAETLGVGMLDIHADLHNPVSTWMTFDVVSHPVLLKSADGILTGQLFLDEDGIVKSGWTSATGTIEASFRGKPLTARVEHQVFIDRTSMVAFPGY